VAPPASADADYHWLQVAIELSRRCPPSATAFSVGAVLVANDGQVLGSGYSRQFQPTDHAEEVALASTGLAADPRLASATLYSSLEPCAERASKPTSCADLIIASGVGRVVVAWREPPIFVPGGGAGRLRKAGLAVTVVPELAGEARAVNGHLLPD
jgi:pyrimidine deaminase RibD-like protein